MPGPVVRGQTEGRWLHYGFRCRGRWMIWKLSKDADSTASHMLSETATTHLALEIILMSFFYNKQARFCTLQNLEKTCEETEDVLCSSGVQHTKNWVWGGHFPMRKTPQLIVNPLWRLKTQTIHEMVWGPRVFQMSPVGPVGLIPVSGDFFFRSSVAENLDMHPGGDIVGEYLILL